MRTIIDITRKVLRVWWITALCVVLMCGCRTFVPVETVRTEIERMVDVQRDSIYVLDSIYVREAHDTVYITKWRTEYKEALRVDTLRVFRRDSINHVIEVEKQLTKIQKLKMDIGTGVMWAAPILIVVGIFLYQNLKR